MSHYSSLIDPTDFGLIADYLRSPRAPIDFILHLKSKDMLAPLAEELAREHPHVNVAPWQFPEVVERYLHDGSLLVSSRHALLWPDPRKILEVTSIPRRALSHVIYLPPYYLAHTPGLFEGTLIRPQTEALLDHEQGRDLSPQRTLRKMNRHAP